MTENNTTYDKVILLCCCIDEPVIFSHCVLKLGHQFHAMLKVCSDRDDIVLFFFKSISKQIVQFISPMCLLNESVNQPEHLTCVVEDITKGNKRR